VARGERDADFVVDVFQTGSGTSTNMNANEVIANRAERAARPAARVAHVHPNDDVNRAQSSNDVIPSALHVAARLAIERDLSLRSTGWRRRSSARRDAFAEIVKLGRTHLQDATPMTVGQEFGGWAAQVRAGIARAGRASAGLRELALGGTAVGTGLNAPADFAARVIARVSAETQLDFAEARDHFEAQGARDAALEASGALKTIAASLSKIAEDVRLLASGPRAGLGELRLPSLQPGSSIMPGKVNPVLCESVAQVAAQVIGNDAAVTIGAIRGQLELNVFIPLIAHNLLESVRLLAAVSVLFADRCIDGIELDEERVRGWVEKSLAMVTALVPEIGYDRAAALAKEAFSSGRTVREVAEEQRVLSREALERALDPRRQARPARALRSSLAAQHGLDPAVRDHPQERDRRVDRDRDRARDEREPDRDRVQHDRQLALEVAADRRREHRVAPWCRMISALERRVAEPRRDHHDAVERRRPRRAVALAEPAGRVRDQRQPEQEQQVRPQDRAVHAARGVQHVVVVVPVDPEIDVAEHVGGELGQGGRSDARSWPGGFGSSSTMIVMMIAITPSLNASSRLVFTPAPLLAAMVGGVYAPRRRSGREERMQLAMVGLGRMGANMTRRLLAGGHDCWVYDVDPAAATRLAGEGAKATTSPRELVDSLATPRVLWLMVPAAFVDDTIARLRAAARPGDVLIDGGNSRHVDDLRRANELRARGIHYVDVGTSGGVFGLERGYCLMIGGEREWCSGWSRSSRRSRLRPTRRAHAGPGGRVARRRARLPALRSERRRPLREDGPQRDRVRPDGRLRGGLQRAAPCGRRSARARGRRRDDARSRIPSSTPISSTCPRSPSCGGAAA
jgi:fumarate hydratase class II